MVNSFSVIITGLRKENGLSQKQASESLKISQALLSHYEKGIRECGLAFIIKVADFYGVSSDYILGRTTDRGSNKLIADDFSKGAGSAELNAELLKHKRQMFNCLHIIYDLTARLQSKPISVEICGILSLYIYHIVRLMATINNSENNEIFGNEAFKTLFSVDGQTHNRYGKLLELLKAEDLTRAEQLKLRRAISLDPKQLETLYPLYAKSLNSLIDEKQKKGKD